MPTRYDYFARYACDLSDTAGHCAATVRTAERRFFRGRQHGVRPAGAELAALRVALYTAVQQAATARGIPYPGDAAVLHDASLVIRTAPA